jgi:hypothetical protein
MLFHSGVGIIIIEAVTNDGQYIINREVVVIEVGSSCQSNIPSIGKVVFPEFR